MAEEDKEKTMVESGDDTEKKEAGAMTIEDTKQQLAVMYLNLLDKQKGGILATGAGVGVNLNPLQKDAVEYLTKDAVKKEKTDIFSNIIKNIKKKFVERFSGGTFLEYDKKNLNKMKALITANKDNQVKLEELMAQIQEGIDPTTVEETAPVPTKETPTIVPVSTTVESGGYQEPFDNTVKGIAITSGFGPRTHPVTGEKNSQHNGIDISAVEGTPIRPIEAGKVIKSEKTDLGGNQITIESHDGRTFSYLHMQELSPFKEGDQVKITDIIGKIGTTGSSNGPHLHLAEKKDGEFVDPLKDKEITKLFDDYKDYDKMAA